MVTNSSMTILVICRTYRYLVSILVISQYVYSLVLILKDINNYPSLITERSKLNPFELQLFISNFRNSLHLLESYFQSRTFTEHTLSGSNLHSTTWNLNLPKILLDSSSLMTKTISNHNACHYRRSDIFVTCNNMTPLIIPHHES